MGYIDAPAGNPAFSTSSDLIPLVKISNTVCSVAKHFASKPLNTYCGTFRDKYLGASRVLEGDFVRDTWMDRRHRIGFFVKAGAGQPVECLRHMWLRHTWLRHPVKPVNAYRGTFC